MGFWDRLFKPKTQTPSEPLTTIAKPIENLLDNLANDLFGMYHELLLRESIVYIVFAVWGAKKDGPLTETQKEIHAHVSPVISNILELLSVNDMTPQQNYAVQYLVRSLLISKITFMIEHLKLHLANQTDNISESSPQTSPPDLLTDDWLNSLSTTNSESWRRKFNNNNES